MNDIINREHKIGIALSGGGAKGIAHIGVIRALQENGIEPTIVAGTSAGSIIGTLYAAGVKTEDMEKMIADSSMMKIFRLFGVPGAGLVKLDYLKERLAEFIKEDSFEALNLPLYVCATNLNQGKAVYFNTGTLFDKVVASCSVPWLFKPIEIEGEMYVDGGITNNMPASIIRDKCDVLIGSNVKPKVHVQSNKELDTFMGITQRVVDLSLWTNAKPNIKLLDVYIAPEKVNDFSFFSMTKVKELCDIGYEETMKKMPKLKHVIQHKEELALAIG
ncbi:MAG: patatin-like phospholipase family protein [Saprospiraceae bacterium]|nr:patatin-like phospholipase family protein [Saprospiraceae bacterium]